MAKKKRRIGAFRVGYGKLKNHREKVIRLAKIQCILLRNLTQTLNDYLFEEDELREIRNSKGGGI